MTGIDNNAYPRISCTLSDIDYKRKLITNYNSSK